MRMLRVVVVVEMVEVVGAVDFHFKKEAGKQD